MHEAVFGGGNGRVSGGEAVFLPFMAIRSKPIHESFRDDRRGDGRRVVRAMSGHPSAALHFHIEPGTTGISPHRLRIVRDDENVGSVRNFAVRPSKAMLFATLMEVLQRLGDEASSSESLDEAQVCILTYIYNKLEECLA